MLHRLLQITDSQFPSGAFAHSMGLEGLAEIDSRSSPGEHAEWLDALWTHQIGPCDAVLGARAHRAAVAGDLERLVALDEDLASRKVARELREASLATGRSFLDEAVETLPDPLLLAYRGRVVARTAPGHHAIAFHAAAAAAGADEAEARVAYAYQVGAHLTATLLRLGRIGHREAQHLLGHFGGVVRERALSATISSFAPRLEIASMRHERQYSRLFRS